jgi:glycosyltransferase involved in cell wall biosynthesis
MSPSPLLDMRHRDAIDPPPSGEQAPFWSVMIPTFNSGDYLSQTLASVLAQDQGPERMQIEVVDDGSDKDDPAEIVAALGNGRVQFTRQKHNVGHIANFHTCIQRARGQVVHLLHGDDLVEPGFYEALEHAFHAVPEIGAAFCRARFIDEDGNDLGLTEQEEEHAGPLPDHLARLAREQRIMTPSVVVRRSAYVELGSFDKRLVCSEDWEMWVRIAARYPVWYEPRPLAKYRMHLHSNTGRHVRSGDDMAYTRQAIDIFADYLPPATRQAAVPAAKQTYARAALGMADRMLRSGDMPAARAQLWQAIRLDASPRIVYAASKIMARTLAGAPKP